MGLNDDLIKKWDEIWVVANALQTASASQDFLPISEGSVLANEDSTQGGFPISHAARWCVAAAIDHLHAVTMLVVDAGVHHLYATSTLARGVIEAAATGLWLLWPEDQSIRDERRVRWWSQNAIDQHKADPNEQRRDRILQALGLDPTNAKHRRGYQMTAVIDWVDDNVEPLAGMGAGFAWRLSSGFAHGRPWAVLGSQHREPGSGDGDDFELTARDETVLFPVVVAAHATTDLCSRFRTLAAG